MKNSPTKQVDNIEVGLEKNGLDHELQIRAKSELIDSMIYQIRTLSNAVIGFSDLLITEPLSDDQCEYVREIHDAGQSLSVLAGDVLDWTQLLSGKCRFTHTKCVLQDIIEDLKSRLSAATLEKGLGYDITIDPRLPAYILCDETQLLKSLTSLVANAVEHTDNGSVRIHVRLDVTSEGASVCFDIADDGVGISPEKIKHLFDITDRSLRINENALSSMCGGLTVRTRLPLIKLVCNLLGGSIEASSELNVGSVFSIRMPTGVEIHSIPKLETFIKKGTEKEDSAPSPRTCTGQILLVEDQPSNRAVISLMLESLGLKTDTAEDGQIAVVKAKGDYDLIIIDLKMPNMDGFEATERLREQGCTIPIVAMSAKVLDEAEHNRIVSMFDGFLVKPVSRSQIAEIVGHYSQINVRQADHELTSSAVSGEQNDNGMEQ